MSGSDSDRSQQELSYYAKDKVKLMKETLKIIKPKRIKAMAPDCIKHLNISEINSMLLEELLGISSKRLTYIFNGEDVDRETSSSDSDDKIDIISLDDISDDDNLELNKSKKNKSNKRKSERGDTVKVKKERTKKSSSINTKKDMDNQSEKSKLMSVLELLELQARARAIRSQLAIETENGKNSKGGEEIIHVKQEDSDSDAVIINSPSHNEIIITSESDLEHEVKKSSIKILSTEGSETASCKDTQSEIKQRKEKLLSKLQKIKLVRHKRTSIESNVNENVHTPNTNTESNLSTDQNEDKPKTDLDGTNDAHYNEIQIASEKDMNCCDNDEIVINLDDDELESMDNV
ncbi:hypothetical protein RI129_000176 [Pyrocoelia pectoralis]|uniref:Uncharacterized protein n=1 Tax=Pyrocoelia pectoralis TaxID=417401 RepID=A0AAN7USJ0_9COLE